MKIPPLLVYSVLRLLAFLVPLGVLWFFFPIMRELWWLTAIFAALIGMSISSLFLRRPLSDASASIYQRRAGRAPEGQEDADAEDAALDADEADAAAEADAAKDAATDEDTR